MLVYVEAGAIFFNSREGLIGGNEIIYRNMETFGLSIHIGRDGQKLTTEAVFLPSNKSVKIWHTKTHLLLISTVNQYHMMIHVSQKQNNKIA